MAFIESINYEQLTEMFGTFLTVSNNLTQAQTDLQTLITDGPPDLPQYVDAEDDYNNAATALLTYNQDVIDLTAAVAAGTPNKEAAQIQVLNVMPPNTWFRFDMFETTGEETPDYYWTGYSTSDNPEYKPYLRVVHQDDPPAVPLTHNMES